MSGFLKLIKKIHLWLGLITGPFVFIIAITGCIYAFQEEIQNITQPYRYYPKNNSNQFSPSEIKSIAEKNNPNKKVHAVMSFSDNHSSKVIFYEFENYYEISYINPETGKIIKHKNENQGFFPFILNGHFYLWLPHEIGQTVVASVTLIFVFTVFSGLFIWWPRSGNRLNRFKIKWKSSWKRINFDLHSVVGFYILGFALIFAITGLVWGFVWFKDYYYTAFTLGDKFVEYYEPESLNKTDDINNQVDKVFKKLRSENPKYDYIEVHFPESELGTIAANVNNDLGTYWKTDYYYFDQKTLTEIPVEHYWDKYKQANLGDKLMRLNYDIHTGAVWGLPGKIFAFLVSLAIASLPITGFLFYLGRKKRKL